MIARSICNKSAPAILLNTGLICIALKTHYTALLCMPVKFLEFDNSAGYVRARARDIEAEPILSNCRRYGLSES